MLKFSQLALHNINGELAKIFCKLYYMALKSMPFYSICTPHPAPHLHLKKRLIGLHTTSRESHPSLSGEDGQIFIAALGQHSRYPPHYISAFIHLLLTNTELILIDH